MTPLTLTLFLKGRGVAGCQWAYEEQLTMRCLPQSGGGAA